MPSVAAQRPQQRIEGSSLGPIQRLASEYLEKDPNQRVLQIRLGLKAVIVDKLADSLQIPKKTLLTMIGLSRSTIDRKIRDGNPLSRSETESVYGILKLVGLAQKIVEESGNPETFNASLWVSEWLSIPHGALGGKRPSEFMDTAEGRALVGDLLLRQQSAAYS